MQGLSARRRRCLAISILVLTSSLSRAQSPQPTDEAEPAAAPFRERGDRPGEREKQGQGSWTTTSAPLEGSVDPARYIIGPGDRLLLTLWGLHDVTTPLEVNAEGALFVPRVGIFHPGGGTLAALRGEVEQRLRMVYPTLNGGLTLSQPRSFVVHVSGAVSRPGAYTATPLTRVSALVTRAGGPAPHASLRHVEVRHGTAAKAEVRIADLVRATLLGDANGDPTVLDGDTVFLPLRDVEVEITGAVKRPGRYELIAGRDVRELLELAGGMTAQMASGLPLRLSERGANDAVAVRSLAGDGARATTLRDGDSVHVPALADLRRVVVVEGAVVGPAGTAELQRAPSLVDRHADAQVSVPRDVSVPVPFVDGDAVSDLLVKVGGLQPWADSANAFLLRPVERATASAASVSGTAGGVASSAGGGVGSERTDGERGPARQRIALDLPAISARQAPDLRVRAGDTLVVPSRREGILVSGAVQRPGLYQYSPELRPPDYVTLAGGPTRSGNADAARVLLRSGGSKAIGRVPTIEPGDAITVPEKRLTTAEWIEITLITSNLIVGTTALVLSQMRRP